MQDYEVTLTAVFTVVVKGASTKDEAEEWAQEEAYGAISTRHIVKTESRLIESADDLDSSVRHADAVSSGD